MAYLINNIKSSPFEGLDYSYMTSKFGYRKFWNDITEMYNTNFHNGVDLTSGTVVIAVEKGKVASVILKSIQVEIMLLYTMAIMFIQLIAI